MSKLKGPPMPMPQKIPNKNPGSNAKVSSDKTMTADGHLAGHDPKIHAVRNKNMGK